MKALSRGQKSWVTKQSRTFSEVLKRPAEFSIIKVSTRKQKTQARVAGLPVTNNRAVVKTGKGGSVRRRKGGMIIHLSDGGTKEVWFASADNFKEVIDSSLKREIGPNQLWSFQIGNNESSGQWPNLYQMMFYLSNEIELKDEDTGSEISLVLTTVTRNITQTKRVHTPKKRKPSHGTG